MTTPNEVVSQEARQRIDLLSGLRRIGIDEGSYRKGHKYLTVVVDHESGRLVWMEVGHDADPLRRFFNALGEERARMLEIVTADGAAWIDEAVRERASSGRSLCRSLSRRLTRLAHGFKRVEDLIALSMLKLAGLCPSLPGRLLPTAPS